MEQLAGKGTVHLPSLPLVVISQMLTVLVDV
jgi:hypothetical protein